MHINKIHCSFGYQITRIMKLSLANAKLFYNKAEKQVKDNFPNLNFFDRAEKIERVLDRKHGEDVSGKIIDAVFENEIN